jgi:hypothetical protein
VDSRSRRAPKFYRRSSRHDVRIMCGVPVVDARGPGVTPPPRADGVRGRGRVEGECFHGSRRSRTIANADGAPVHRKDRARSHRLGRCGFAASQCSDDASRESAWENTDWSGVPNGIRTRVLALKGPRPRPLDDRDARRELGIVP